LAQRLAKPVLPGWGLAKARLSGVGCQAMIVADLHIHSRYSRATSRDLDPEHLWLAAQLKGVDLVGSGDFTHPAWFQELSEKLVETGDGAYTLKPDLQRDLAKEVPGPCRREVRFLLSAEISSIYKRGGKTRKVHSLILMPDLSAVERLNQRLGRLGNITSDGRPILGLDAKDLLELCLEVDPSVIFIPAHIWTPWFSLFGSKSGFDTIEECFAELTPHIHALETGLSSDPPMNWRLSALDRYILVSHSDAHSHAKLAREADLLTCPPTYQDLAKALAGPVDAGFYGTLEFFPDEGKYHLDGHRKCNVRLEPAETIKLGGRCPVCGRPLTVGVLSRVEELADRPPGAKPAGARYFESLIPLHELIGEVMQRGPATKGVRQAVETLQNRLGPELYILREAPAEELESIGGPLLAEAISRMRQGRVITEGGYDGEFGKVHLFSPAEISELMGQKGFWKLAPKSRVKKKALTPAHKPKQDLEAPLLTLLDPAGEGLNPEQSKAAAFRESHLIVRAGPGTGKTRLLVQRAVGLIEEGVAPEKVLMITFTRKAAGELRERLAATTPAAGKIWATTFHALGRQILAQASLEEPAILEEEQRQAIIKPIAEAAGLKPAELELAISAHKQRLDQAPPEDLAPSFAAYQDALDRAQAVDLDDLVRGAVLALEDDAGLAKTWQERFTHILVDEYQDVNQVQVALLQALTGPVSQVAAIGDPDQAIYGFRGADRSFFARFGRDFSGAVQMELNRNYRSTAPILAAAQGLMSADPDPLRPALSALCQAGPLPAIIALPSPEAEADWVAERIAALIGGVDSRQVEGPGRDAFGDYAPRDIAVLYRLHALAPALKRSLERAGVPVQVASRTPLAETDPLDFKAQRVSLLTMHAAKGLEWPVVFLVGLEQGLLPYLPPGRPPAPAAEERRLLYVAMTRAREKLYLCRAGRRTLFGETRRPGPSPFLAEMPPGLLQMEKPRSRRRKAQQMGLFA
jgi:DNA helicase-2/ATP-dependent DNA helicase PcrA